MRCPKCFVETPAKALCCPGCKLPTPNGRTYKKHKVRKVSAKKKARPEGEKKSVGPVVICGLGSYLGMKFLAESHAEPTDLSHMALERLRQLPSSEPGMTVEEYLDREVERSRDAQRLQEAEGWEVRPIDGSAFLVRFTFEEKGRKQKKPHGL